MLLASTMPNDHGAWSMKSAIVIPARYGSSRFPGKPLALINGMPMLERTWRIAKQAAPDQVFITTDDSRIENLAKGFGAEVVRTDMECANGTERVYQALRQIGAAPDIILNLQGDAVLTPPWVLTDLIKAMESDPQVQLATPATKLSLEQFHDLANQKASGIVGGTLVVFDKNFNAMYFSKSPIPFIRSTTVNDVPIYRHIGLYAYTFATLKQYLDLPVGPLETVEGLEQLRALENGIPIRIVLVDYKGRTHWSVDSPDDVHRVEEIIASQGELFEELAVR
jgi:3-deoxy-manno-octulosonate cytidylyltransferase (CMP-KDO synthetase)